MSDPKLVFMEDKASEDNSNNNILKKREESGNFIIFRNLRYTYPKKKISFTAKYLQVFIQSNHVQEMIGMGVFIDKKGKKRYPNKDMLRNDDFCFVGNQVYYNNLKKMYIGNGFFGQIKDCMTLDEDNDSEFSKVLCEKYRTKTIDDVKKYLDSGEYRYELKYKNESKFRIENNKVYLIGDREIKSLKESLESYDKTKYFRRAEDFHISTRGFSDVIDEPSRKLFIFNNSLSNKQNNDVNETLDVDSLDTLKDGNDNEEVMDFHLRKELSIENFDQIKLDSALEYGVFTDLRSLWDEINNLSINDKGRVYKQIRKLGKKFPKYHESYYNFMVSGKDYIAFNPVDYDDYFYPFFVLVQIIQKAKKNSFVIIDFDKISEEIDQVITEILNGLKSEKKYTFKTFIYKRHIKRIKERSNAK